MAPELDRELAICRRKNDLIALSLSDPREYEFPNVGFLTLYDPELGETIEVDTGNALVRHYLAERLQGKRNEEGINC